VLIFRNQPYYRAPRGSLIGVSLDCADNPYVVKMLAVRAGYRPPKLPDFGTSLAIESLLQPYCIRLLLHRGCGAERIFRHSDNGRLSEGEISRVNCFAVKAALFLARPDGDNLRFAYQPFLSSLVSHFPKSGSSDTCLNPEATLNRGPCTTTYMGQYRRRDM
jgi:hypothetical protein